MMTTETAPSRNDRLRELAVAGLRIEAMPIMGGDATEHRRLFEIRHQISQIRHALTLLRESYDATAPERLSEDDGRIFEREIIRRQRQLVDLKRERDQLLLIYAEQLLQSAKIHPDLHALAERVPLAS
jgi:predicted phosphohydrolase